MGNSSAGTFWGEAAILILYGNPVIQVSARMSPLERLPLTQPGHLSPYHLPCFSSPHRRSTSREHVSVSPSLSSLTSAPGGAWETCGASDLVCLLETLSCRARCRAGPGSQPCLPPPSPRRHCNSRGRTFACLQGACLFQGPLLS